MGRISNIVIADSGEQYLGVPTVSISLPDGDSAVATATLTIVNGIVTGTSVTSPGTFYTSSSVVALSDATYLPKKKAAATTTLASYKGGISSITLDSGGSYYNDISGENVVLIDSPLTTLPNYWIQSEFTGLWFATINASKTDAITLNTSTSLNTGSLKMDWYNGSAFAKTFMLNKYLYTSENFKLQWADDSAYRLNLLARSNLDDSFYEVWSNVFIDSGVTIEFSWDGEVFSLWHDSDLIRKDSLSSDYLNRTFLPDGNFTLGNNLLVGDPSIRQFFDNIYLYDDVSVYDSASSISTHASNVVYSEDFTLPVMTTATASITKDSHGHINSIIIIDSGSGYYSIPSVEFSNPDGTESDWPTALTTNIENGEIISLNIVQNGGVLDSANITIGLPLGARESFRATAVANYDEITSKISSVRMIDSGNFYVSPTVTIGLSPIASTSDFIIGDTVYEDLPSGVRIQGEVTKWIESAGQVYLAHVGANDGNLHTFTVDGRLISTRLTNLKPAVNRLISGVAENNQISNTEQNDYFDSLTDFLDFSETNPFGEPS